LVITLISISRMFTGHEFKELTGAVPDDFHKTEQKFWEYVTQKLNLLVSRITYVFSSTLFTNSKESILINNLVRQGIRHVSTPDDVLLAEVFEWFRMTRKAPNEGVFQLYEDSLQEIQQHILTTINNTLQDGELGILFLSPSIQMTFPKTFRIIRMLPFNPLDYLTRYLTLKKLRLASDVNAS
jgi:hypothetical protein